MATKKYVSLSKLSVFLDNLKNTFASLSHTHKIADIKDYTVDSTLSSTSANPVQNKVVDAEFEAISEAMNALETAIDGKASESHNHDDLYYTETEINTKLANKSDISHTHNDIYYTKAEMEDVEFVTISDIDTICGTSIQVATASEVTF